MAGMFSKYNALKFNFRKNIVKLKHNRFGQKCKEWKEMVRISAFAGKKYRRQRLIFPMAEISIKY
jgi:hypothetical protein